MPRTTTVTGERLLVSDKFLQPAAETRIIQQWDEATAIAMIALHAKRSANSVRRFRDAFPERPIAVVLTGTDAYGDMNADPQVLHTLDCASYVVVLQEEALHRPRSEVSRQSTRDFAVRIRVADRKKSGRPQGVRRRGPSARREGPLTFTQASVALRGETDARFVHIGEALEPEFAASAVETMNACEYYQWLGNLSQADARMRIAEARALVHMSRLEGGANVVIEAIRSFVPVLAGHIDGNVGLLGKDYGGYFPVGDVTRLVELTRRLSNDKAFYAALKSAARAASSPVRCGG